MSIITNKYRTKNAKNFIADFSDNNFFVFASAINNIGTLTINSEFSKNEFLEKTIFGKKVSSDEVFHAIPIYRWQSNEVYTQYDDKIDLTGKQFYVVIYPQDQETGDYRVFKCLFNNYGAQSMNAPNYNANVPNQIYRTPDDKYVWKFMCSISNNDFEKYNALGFMPIVDYFIDTQGNKSIDQIFIENELTNIGYETVSGVIIESQPTLFKYLITGNDLNEIESYYKGQSIYITNPSNSLGRLYEISSYNFNVNSKIGTITIKDDDADETFIQEGFIFNITPRIQISGDGTGAKAYPVIENNQIINIEIYNSGENYSNSSAIVIDPLFGFNPDEDISIDQRAVLRPIISPEYGHGTDVVSELLSKHVLIYSGISFTDNAVFPITNKFSKMGLVKNPEFNSTVPIRFDNRIKIELEVNPLSVDEVVTQINNDITNTDYDLGETFFRATVHETNNEEVYLTNYMGPFVNITGTSTSLIPSEFVRTPQGQLLTISLDANTQEKLVSQSPYIQRTGEVLYMSEFSPIERTSESNEQFKLILEF